MSFGLYGSGMHRFILDEAELGTRVAMALSAEEAEPDGWFYDILLQIDCQKADDLGDVPPLPEPWLVRDPAWGL